MPKGDALFDALTCKTAVGKSMEGRLPRRLLACRENPKEVSKQQIWISSTIIKLTYEEPLLKRIGVLNAGLT